jgi:short-subunit dehydrogenase
MRIDGQTVVVTGASRGIGKATAEALGRAGARLAILARSPEIEAVAAAIAANGGTARGYVADAGNPDEMERTARRIVSDLGNPAIVINNAGAGRWLHVEETPAQEVASMMAAPYFAAFYATRAFLPAMLARSAGCIVNINSPVAYMPWPGATGYLCARFAMRGFSESLRLDLRGNGVRVLEVVPSEVTSTYFENNPHSRERLPTITRLVPQLSPEQVAEAIVRGLERGRTRIVMPFMLKAALLTRALAPGLVDWLMWRTGARRAPGEPKGPAGR